VAKSLESSFTKKESKVKHCSHIPRKNLLHSRKTANRYKCKDLFFKRQIFLWWSCKGTRHNLEKWWEKTA